MLRALLVAVLTISPAAQQAQVPAVQSGASASPAPKPEELLQRSHDLALELAPLGRAEVLSRIAEVAARHRLPNAMDLIEELFSLGQQVSVLDRDGPEGAAAKAVAILDPMRALQMLDRMEEPAVASDTPYIDQRAAAAERIFPGVFELKGRPMLPKLRERATRMGTTGQYPYSAWTPIISALSSPEEAAALFQDAVGAYAESGPNDAAARDFASFLKANWRRVPADVAQTAVRQAVAHLVTEAEAHPEESFHLRIFTPRGLIVFNNPAQLRLARLIRLTEHVDPELAGSLKKSFPLLDQAPLNYAGEMMVVPEEAPQGASLPVTSPPYIERSRIIVEADYLVRQDVSAAVSFALAITEPLARSEALDAIIEVVASSDRPRALDLLQKARAAAELVPDTAGQFLAWTHLCEAAVAAKDDTTVLAAANHSFATSSKLLADGQAIDPLRGTPLDAVPFLLIRVARPAARVQPALVLTRTNDIQDPKLKALLLVEVAEGLWSKQDPSPVEETGSE